MQFYTFYKAGVPKASLPQLFRVMRITAFLILVTLLQVSASSYSQQLTMQKSQASLKEIFTQINIQTGYDVVVSSTQLKNTKKISVSFNKTALQEVLDQVLKNQNLSYTISDKTIVITEKKEEPSFLDKVIARFQRIDIKGLVVDSTGNPIAGATVKVKGFKQSTTTDNIGRFGLANVEDNATIVISFLGFKTIELPANGNFTRIVLITESSELNEVNIVNKGYYQEKRELSTGNVSRIDAQDIERQPITNPLLALQGRLAGLEVKESNGIGGAAIKLQIRGVGSLGFGSDPLFIIDGVPYATGNTSINQLSSVLSQGGEFQNGPQAITGVSVSNAGLSPFSSINPRDIESISILKDADATSIYGSRGSNGVVLITTKKGKSGKTTLSGDINSGYRWVGRFVSMMNTDQYLEMRREAFRNDGITPDNNPGSSGYAPDLTEWDTDRYTDWQKWLLGKTAKNTNVNIALNGGTEQTKFAVTGNYSSQNNLYPSDLSDNKGGLRFSLSHESKDRRLQLNFGSNYSVDLNKLFTPAASDYVNLPPNLPSLYNADGTLVWQFDGVPFENPAASFLKKYESNVANLNSNLQINYRILNGLQFKINFGYNLLNNKETSINPIASQNPISNPSALGSATFARNSFNSLVVEPQLEYKFEKSWGKISVLTGGSYNSSVNEGIRVNANNYATDALLNSITAAPNVTSSSSYEAYKYVAVFGRINYNFQDRYIINLSARRDGSSRFGANRRFNNFSAIGAGWIFSNESFIKDNTSFLSFGKIRGSIGSTGNDQIGNYKFLDSYSPALAPFNNLTSLVPSSLSNADYVWERVKKYDIGIELGFLNDRLNVATDYYIHKSDNQLLYYALPTQTGFYGIIRNLPARIRNSGWEVAINSTNFNTSNFSWKSSLNFTIPKNKVTSFPDLENSSYAGIFSVGYPVNIVYGYKSLGIDSKDGLYKFQDVDGNGTITTADKQILGTTDPRFYGGLNNAFVFKELELSVFLDFKKQKAPNYLYFTGGMPPGTRFNQLAIFTDRWQKPGDIADYQQYTTTSNESLVNLGSSDAAFSDASYIKLRSISLAYSLNLPILKTLKINKCKIYLQGQNLATMSKYKGGDPEIHNYTVVPPLRAIIAGINLEF